MATHSKSFYGRQRNYSYTTTYIYSTLQGSFCFHFPQKKKKSSWHLWIKEKFACFYDISAELLTVCKWHRKSIIKLILCSSMVKGWFFSWDSKLFSFWVPTKKMRGEFSLFFSIPLYWLLIVCQSFHQVFWMVAYYTFGWRGQWEGEKMKKKTVDSECPTKELLRRKKTVTSFPRDLSIIQKIAANGTIGIQ